MALPTDAAGLVAAARSGSVRAVARLLSRVENGGSAAAEVAAVIRPGAHPPGTTVVGLTGPPGVGKSTTTAALIATARKQNRRVAVLAVDPSSPFSGGALLGDRVRMAAHATDPQVYIRSMASRGQLGGLSAATPGAVDLLSAVGFEVVLVETVGVGQNEVDVMRLVDTVVVVVAPGMGDGVQAAKAGILEIADLLVVNKADREGATTTVRDLRAMLAVGRSGSAAPGGWRVPVLPMVAIDGTGVAELTEALAQHREHLVAGGGLGRRRRGRAAAGIRAGVLDRVERVLSSAAGRHHLAQAAAAITAGTSDQYRAADDLLRWLAADGGNPPAGTTVGPA